MMARQEGCIFCQIVAGEAPSHNVYEDEHCVGILDIFPATRGHSLVIPRSHSRNLWDIDPEEARPVWDATFALARQVRDALSPAGMNILHAIEPAGFQTVFHFHTHVIPRYEDDGLKPPWVPREPSGGQEELARLAEEIRAARS